MITQVAAAILAGGRATRMGGRPKSFLEVDGRRIIDRQLDVLRGLFAEILIAANDATAYGELGVRVVPDRPGETGHGPLAGLGAALAATRADHVLLVACDMPELSAAVLREIADLRRDHEAVVPVVDGHPQPLQARYGRACAAAVSARLARGERKITLLFEDVRTCRIPEAELRLLDPELRSFRNVNSPADLC